MRKIMVLGLAMGAPLFGAACDQDGAKPEQQPQPQQQQQAQQPQKQPAAGKQGQQFGQGAPSGQGQRAQPAMPPPAPATGYDLSAIKAIPDNCSSPAVLLASAPKSVGADYPWSVSRQALLANQQFKVVSGPPSAPGEISVAPHGYNDNAYALVATCKDGGTCNQIAAMYKAIVRSSNPQVVCGKVQGISASPVSSFRWDPTPQGNLPGDKDAQALCARLSACMIATDRATPGDPFLECQKKPQTFKTECATRYPCAEVLACTGK